MCAPHSPRPSLQDSRRDLFDAAACPGSVSVNTFTYNVLLTRSEKREQERDQRRALAQHVVPERAHKLTTPCQSSSTSLQRRAALLLLLLLLFALTPSPAPLAPAVCARIFPDSRLGRRVVDEKPAVRCMCRTRHGRRSRILGAGCLTSQRVPGASPPIRSPRRWW